MTDAQRQADAHAARVVLASPMLAEACTVMVDSWDPPKRSPVVAKELEKLVRTVLERMGAL